MSSTPPHDAVDRTHPARGTRGLLRLWPTALLIAAAAVPFGSFPLPGLLAGPVGSPGNLQLLALCLLFGALATGYDLLLGRAGLLSFGHVLYFAFGAYATNTVMLEAHLPFPVAALIGVLAGTALSAALGAVSLRVSGIGFSMVTLAFAQAFSIVVSRDPGGLTGGEEGRAAPADLLPGGFVGIDHTADLYWLALGCLLLTLGVSAWALRSPLGRVWDGISQNEQRVEVLGLRPYGFKLTAFVIAGALAALAGTVHLLLTGGATPGTTTTDFSLSLLVMVVLGGSGSRWGPMIGGILYTWADQRLSDVAGSGAVASLPGVLRVPLSQPLFLLGALFVVVVAVLPGGLARLPARIAAARREKAARTRPADATPPAREAAGTARAGGRHDA
ncbi:branched-chain amino acid ABC transporter permease [Streptomyces sp. NRRL F-5126]|uniref:branched-chain amino acid ABC transporter permease n=1 Tax=Streptomyces sp. NRRL F-5126 TaxID=1463857 RepID=UPI00099C19DA|nr:branched-chain amino acid ABC transporter permease [Streptomyces sp. NRRL F-5126]